MPSKERAALLDILENIRLAREFLSGHDESSFATDPKSFYAATRCLEIVSEASRRLSDDLKTRRSDVPWRQVANAGNLYRHGYQAVDPSRIWDTIVESLPALENAVADELNRIKD